MLAGPPRIPVGLCALLSDQRADQAIGMIDRRAYRIDRQMGTSQSTEVCQRPLQRSWDQGEVRYNIFRRSDLRDLYKLYKGGPMSVIGDATIRNAVNRSMEADD
jgi:hypothetical protein